MSKSYYDPCTSILLPVAEVREKNHFSQILGNVGVLAQETIWALAPPSVKGRKKNFYFQKMLGKVGEQLRHAKIIDIATPTFTREMDK